MALSYSTNALPQYQVTQAPQYQTPQVAPQGGAADWLSILGGIGGIASSLSSPYGAGSQINQRTSATLPWEQQQYQTAYGYNNAAAARTAGQAVAGLTPDQLAAMQNIRGSMGFEMPDLGASQGTAAQLAQGISPTQIQNFFNPYQQTAINQTMSDIARQRDISSAGVKSAANAAGAWGGDRGLVAQNLSDDSYNRAMASTAANMENTGYQNATQAAFQNQSAQLSGNQQLQQAILNRINANNSQNQNLLTSGNQQQTQNQNTANWAIQQGQIAGQNLNPQVGYSSNGQDGTKVDPVSGAIQGLQGGLQMGSTLSQLLKQIPGLSGVFNSNYSNMGLGDQGGSGYVQSGNGSTYAPDGTDINDPSNWGDPSQWGFSSAGGEAAGYDPVSGQTASNPQSTNEAAVAGYQAPSAGGGLSYGNGLAAGGNALGAIQGFASGTPQGIASGALNATAGANRLGAFGSSSSTVGKGLGVAGSGLGIYNGIQQGGGLGYGSAAVNAGRLATQLGAFGGPSGTLGSTLGPLGAALGVVGGIKQGGVAGYGSAALNGVQLYNSAQGLINGSSAAAGASGAGGASAGLGAAAGGATAVAAPLSAILTGMMSQPYTLNKDWWDNFQTSLTKGTSGNANYDKFDSPASQQYQAKQSLYNMILRGPTQNDFGQKGAGIPPQIMSLAQSYGMLNPDGSLNTKWTAGPDPSVPTVDRTKAFTGPGSSVGGKYTRAN
jgi:hypothetical protein